MIKGVSALVWGQLPRLARHWRALVLSGSLLVGTGLPVTASADGSEEVVAFVAGTAVGYLLGADDDRRVHHHHGYSQPAYVVTGYPVYHHAPRGYYAPPPVQVVHYYDYTQPRYHKRHHRRGGWDRGRHGHYDD